MVTLRYWYQEINLGRFYYLYVTIYDIRLSIIYSHFIRGNKTPTQKIEQKCVSTLCEHRQVSKSSQVKVAFIDCSLSNHSAFYLQ